MNRMPIKILCLPVLLMLAACAGTEKAMPESHAQAHVTGSATYRERMMLPPQAELTATLEDVSLADAPLHAGHGGRAD